MAEENPTPDEQAEQSNEQPDEAAPPEQPTPIGADWEQNAAEAKAQAAADRSRWERFKDLAAAYWRHKKWTLPLTIVILLAVVLGIPSTRYATLGLAIKKNVTVVAVDSVNGQLISGMKVTSGSASATTNSGGQATLRLPVGPHTISLAKKYYKAARQRLTVQPWGSVPVSHVKVVATGRQVPVTVTDIFGTNVAEASISVLDTTAKTNGNGQAIIALPTTASTQSATVTADGYNSKTVTLQVTDSQGVNKVTLAPAGAVYFLSNKSGTIDVVKTNLDGSGRKTVLAGTGSEDVNGTSLIPSGDWKYAILISKRDGGKPGLYLINTATDDTVNIDSGDTNTTYLPVGWSGDTFVYRVLHSNVNQWQSGVQVLKSYDAAGGRLYSIDQTTGQGAQDAYASTSFGFVNLIGTKVVYGFAWTIGGSNLGLGTGKSNNIWEANVDGSSKRDLQDIPLASTWNSALSAVRVSPTTLNIQSVMQLQPNGYYVYASDSVSQSNTVNDDSFAQSLQNTKNYLVSPSGKQIFWAEPRDSQNTLFTADQTGQNSKQIAALKEDVPYGWYTDKYLLVSSGGNELYIMPVSGSKEPYMITDYYKSATGFAGYGGN